MVTIKTANLTNNDVYLTDGIVFFCIEIVIVCKLGFCFYLNKYIITSNETHYISYSQYLSKAHNNQ